MFLCLFVLVLLILSVAWLTRCFITIPKHYKATLCVTNSECICDPPALMISEQNYKMYKLNFSRILATWKFMAFVLNKWIKFCNLFVCWPLHGVCHLPDGIEITIGSGVCCLGDGMRFWIWNHLWLSFTRVWNNFNIVICVFTVLSKYTTQ